MKFGAVAAIARWERRVSWKQSLCPISSPADGMGGSNSPRKRRRKREGGRVENVDTKKKRRREKGRKRRGEEGFMAI